MQGILKCIRYTLFTNQNTHTNLYKTLGLKHTATQKQIRNQFYDLAKKYHPDVCKDPEATNIFSEITIAYQILSDQRKKSQYDSKLEKDKDFKPYPDRTSKKSKAKFDSENYQPFEEYDSYFGRNKHHLKPKKGENINVNTVINLKQSFKGVKKRIAYSRKSNCVQCSQKVFDSCYPCGGKGSIFNRKQRDKQKCQGCNGRGFKNNCKSCNGTGEIMLDVVDEIYIPKNTHDKTILRLNSQGHYGYKHDNGDLIITVHVEQSQNMKVDGNNIHSELQINYLTAILGGKVKVETIEGDHEIIVNAGTQSGDTIRVFNRGLVSEYSKRRGDQIIKFKIKVPKPQSQRQRQLLRDLLQYSE